VKSRKGTLYTFRAANEKECNEWVIALCRAKDRTLEERSKLLEIWEGEAECLACVEALATEDAEIEDEEEMSDNTTNGIENSSMISSISDITQSNVHPNNNNFLLKSQLPSEIEILSGLLSITLYDINSSSLPLRETFKDRTVIVLALLRHFGCVLCRNSAKQLAKVKTELDSLNIGLVAIGSGTPSMAKTFQEDFDFPGDLYVDQKREVFKALHCKRGLRYVLSPKAMLKMKEAISQGILQGRTQGDGL
jgi:peroxiredoxin